MNSDFYLARELVEQVMSRAAITPVSREAHARRATRYRELLSNALGAEPNVAAAASSGRRF